MADSAASILATKREIVRELFINTADDNYISARWCYIERLNVDYFWLAVHALEKYMKAALLLNGFSGKGFRDEGGRFQTFSHKIPMLYERVKCFAAEFLPENLSKPDELAGENWREETPESMLRRFYRNGNADNRYQIFGFLRFHEDLFKLDSMVYALRRLCVPLDAYFLGARLSGSSNPKYRDMLTDDSKYWALIGQCKLRRTADG